MDWANERYVRLYTKDTGDWLMWPWQTRALFCFILRKADRAGVVHFGKGGIPALAAMVGVPSHDVTEWIAPLVSDGCVRLNGEYLCVPNYIAAQETPQSDRARQRQSRERARDRIIHATGREPSSIEIEVERSKQSHTVTTAVTVSHEPSHDVTGSHSVPSLAVPSRAESDAREESLTPEETTRVRLISEAKPKKESDYDTAKRVWVELWSAKYGEPYIFQPASGPGSEDYALQRLGRAAKDVSGGRTEPTLRHWVKSFLRDSGARNWLSENKHPLRSIERDLNKYGLPKAIKPTAKPQDADKKEVPLSVEEQKQRAEALAGLVGKIGAGR